jgi:hypothetical protein
MKVFPVILVILVCVLITLGTVFAGGIFQSVSIEAGNTTASEAQSITAYTSVSAWIYIIAALLMLTAIVLAFRLFRESPS